MFEIKNLNFSYKKNVPVLKDLSLTLEIGKIHGLVGLNGSGKTTLLNVIYGNLKAENGEIQIKGENITKNDIAFLETDAFFYSKITGEEYLKIFRFANKNFDIELWNSLFKLPLNKLIDNYSTGMKKKLAFISLMSFEKPFYILDEPFNGIDLETNQIIKNILLKMREKGKTILITSHIFDILFNICNTVSYLNNQNINFTKSENQFNEIEKIIFSHIDNQNNQIIEQLIY